MNTRIGLTSDEILRVAIEGFDERQVVVPSNSQQLVRVYVSARPDDRAAGQERTDFRLWVLDLANDERAFAPTTFFGRGDTE